MKLMSYVSNVFVIVAFLTCTSCQPPSIYIEIRSDPDQMEREILQAVPVGTLITNAEKIMKQNNFACEYVSNTSYSKFRKPGAGSIESRTISYKPSDILSCQITRSYYFIAYTKWRVIFAYKNQRVSNVVVSIESTGP